MKVLTSWEACSYILWVIEILLFGGSKLWKEQNYIMHMGMCYFVCVICTVSCKAFKNCSKLGFVTCAIEMTGEMSLQSTEDESVGVLEMLWLAVCGGGVC